MKIILRPAERWWIEYQVTCQHCFTEIELEKDDNVRVNNSSNGAYAYFNCPHCNVLLQVERRDYTDKIKEFLNNTKI